MKWTDQFLDQKRFETDPLADDVISALIKSKGLDASKELFNHLISNIDLQTDDLPDEIKAFLGATFELPPWLSKEDLKQSNLFFVDHGPKMLLLLYFKSLPLLYSDVKGAQVLVKTSRLTHNQDSIEIFTRRIAETGQFLLNVMANNYFIENDKAINTIRKVRLIHAAIRHFLSFDWDEQLNGIPINQEDMALTLMTFSISLLDGLAQMGVNTNEHQRHAFFERWRAIGVILGVAEELIPESIEDGRLLLNKILERQSGPSESGKLLTKALVTFSKETIPGKIFDVTPEALITFFTGKDIANYLGIGKPGCLGFGIPAIIASFFRLVEKLEDRSDKIEYFTNKLSQRLVLAMVGYFDTYKQRQFEIPSEFKGAWNI